MVLADDTLPDDPGTLKAMLRARSASSIAFRDRKSVV